MISKAALRRLLPVLLTVALAGCANIYDANLFQNFDGPPSASELAKGSLDDIADAAESPQFFEELEDDPDAKQAIQDKLQSIYNDSTASESDRRTAAIISGDIEMETTAGGDIVNNVVDVLLSDSGGDFSDPATLINSIFPESIRNDADALAAQIESFKTAAAAYNVYGTGLTDGGVPEGANSGEIAQRAAVAVLVDTLAADAENNGRDFVADIQSGDFSGYSDPTTTALGTESSPEPLRNILDVAGLTSVVEGG